MVLIMRIFITGICGFIGHNIALYLHSKGYEILGVDNFKHISLRAPKILKSLGIKIYKIDIRDYERIKYIIKDVGIVIHTAVYVDFF